MAKLGDLVRDEITGFSGVVLARQDALYEASLCRVHARNLMDNGEVRGGVWFEEDRLIVEQETVVVGFRCVKGVESESLTSQE